MLPHAAITPRALRARMTRGACGVMEGHALTAISWALLVLATSGSGGNVKVITLSTLSPFPLSPLFTP
jgi:hypothetical protein